MTALQNQWLIAQGKVTLETKASIKKTANMEKKKAETENKIYKKAQSKDQSRDIRRLALNNSQAIEVGTFQKFFSDPLTAFDEYTNNTSKPSILKAPLQALLSRKRTFSDKKKTRD